jgi:5-(carboxyamino)imidazole ribonucleotide mutase|tara:strand:+ start:12582 stop:13070 length:489 start_codon:yes stop_codon:yes gene_type:complete
MTKENIISVIMGSNSDFPIMNNACKILEEFGVHYEKKIISAHRTPDRLYEFAKNAKKNNIKAIIAGAGGAAHLPGMVASMTTIPVLGVPIASKNLKGIDSLLSIVQMPCGIPVGSFAIGEAGAKNAALMAIAILALNDQNIAQELEDFREKQTNSIELNPSL